MASPRRARVEANDSLPRQFWLVMAASLVSVSGDGLMFVALPLLAKDLTSSALVVAGVVAAHQLPWLLFGVPVGVRVDRARPIPAMVLADSIRAIAVLLLGIAVVFDHATIPALYAVAMTLGIGDVIFSAANGAIIPSLVRVNRLDRANSVSATASAVGEAGIGPLAGGALYAAGRSIPFFGDAATFALSAALLRTVRTPIRIDINVEPRRVSARAALRWYFSIRSLRLLTLLTMVLAFAHTATNSVLVLIATEDLGLTDTQYGLFYAITAASNILGGLLATVVWSRWGTKPVLAGAAVLTSLAYIVTGSSTVVVVTGLALFVESLVVPVGNVILTTLRQTIAPAHRLSQVTNIFRLCVYSSVPVGAVVGGLLAEHFGALRSATVAGLTVAVLGAFIVPKIWREPSIAEGPRSLAGHVAEDRIV